MIDAETKNKILGIYEELKGIVSSMPEELWFDDEGFADHANGVIQRAGSTCPEIIDIRAYILEKEYSQNRGNIVYTVPAKSKLNALIGRLRGTYDLDLPPTSNGHTFIQNQSQTQSLSIALDFQERILKEISKHEVGTKERTFLEKIKAVLPTIKSITDIMSSALKIGAELGLDPATIHSLLSL